MSKITRTETDDDTSVLKAIQVFRFVQIYMSLMNSAMALFMYFGVPALHYTMPDSTRMLLVTLFVLSIPIEIIIMEVVIRQKKKKLGPSERQSIQSSKL